MRPRSRLLGLVLGMGAAMALAVEPAVAQTAPAPTEAAPPEAPVPVEPDAPPGSSGQVAAGAAIGVVVGLAVLILVFSSGSSD